MGLVVLVLHVLGWGTLLLLVLPAHHQLGTEGVFGVGLGVTAYTLGVRHAFDADHIAAIDNATRGLMEDPRPGTPRPLSVGFWFSVGHSTVVLLLVVLLTIGVRSLADQIGDETSILQRVSGPIGLAVSGTFLLLVGIFNLVALVGIARLARRTRCGRANEATLEGELGRRGLASRLLSPLMRAIRRPWHLYAVGLLFGIGFDTATEIGLLALAGGAAVFSVPWYATFTLPVLFAAGMILFDAADGVLMTHVYGWAAAHPARRLYYNLAVTGVSVAVALVVGSVELASVLVGGAGITSGPLEALARLDLGAAGLVVLGLLVAPFLTAYLLQRHAVKARQATTDDDS